ncbi:MAG TPA: UDP-N-acetylglucosamine--N-acetylmuramyl-(pentapeptide) pyrophosphoryl-undecaprenol N-acetylglucosamine transferase [Acidimicrobiales bacterium]|nr:UDP-N-acetylglucosamine--N-acetylmuramyl-(pentapeptide) pyrophosphoryl-undecaprenol N-acetylglucosamine transferase [Acidimicrobiales bacterium]
MTGTWAVIAGGGTAGHVVPGLAVARALVDRGHPPESIHWVGSQRGSEGRMVAEAGFEATLLPGRGIQRKLTAENLGAAWGLTRAGGQALSLVRRRQPAVVLAMGGWASVSCALAAVAQGVPVVVAEQNAVPGAANRLVGRFAKASAVPFPGTPLPRSVVTGNPVRAEILSVDRSPGGRAAARAALGLPEGRRVVAVFGGSLGALRLNNAVVGALEAWAGRDDVAVRHVVGERDWSLVTGQVGERPAGGVFYQPVRYDDQRELSLAAADLAVSRAGGNTVAELAAVGLPSVLVPLPDAPGDHQTANARHLSDVGAAVLVADAELTGTRFVAEVDGLLGDEGRLAAMGQAASTAGRRDAAEAVAALVEAHAAAGGRPGGGRG